MIPLLFLLSVLCGSPAVCLEEDRSFVFDGELRRYAVANNTVYIATAERLYQLSHDLSLVRNVTQRGVLKPGTQKFHRAPGPAQWNATFRVNVLLPFVKNGSLISCGVTDNECGYCEVRDLKDISTLLYSEQTQVGSLRHSSASLAFLVRNSNVTYILTAIQPGRTGEGTCTSDSQVINLHDVDHKTRALFSLSDVIGTQMIKSKSNVEFVDGFQINSTIYLLSNVPSDDGSNKVRLIWLESKSSKRLTLKSLRGATLTIPGGSKWIRLVTSSLIPGETGRPSPVLWSGVFTEDEGERNTVLLVFDISPDFTGDADMDPDFYFSKKTSGVTPILLQPKAELLKWPRITSVMALRQEDWMVFFIGTEIGFFRNIVDRNFKIATTRFSLVTKSDIFTRIQLDQVDHKYVYIPNGNKLNRVPVAVCSTYTNVQDCWSAQDPYCVWCGSKTSCTFKDACEDSDWVSIPEVYQPKMISHRVVQDSTGEMLLKIQVHVKVGRKVQSNSSCRSFHKELCCWYSHAKNFPQCTCRLSRGIIPADGLLVSVKMRLGSTYLTEQLQLTNCSDISGPPTMVLSQKCIQAGCEWRKTSCSFGRAGDTNIVEISSITPSVVSLYGGNNAALSGRNLSHVTRVRVHADLDCTTRESPVWNNTDTSLSFHIPSTDNKGVVKVCVVHSDDNCYGNATIIYKSSPVCNGVSPSSTWNSGGRKMTLIGSHLDFVEEVFHSHAPQELQLPTNRNYQNLTYDSPTAADVSGRSGSSVFLKVANQTLTCSSKITYHPDPDFTGFTSAWIGDIVFITLHKEADKLEMTPSEFSVWGVIDGVEHPCMMTDRSRNTDIFICEIRNIHNGSLQKLTIKYGNKTVWLRPPTLMHPVIAVIRLMLIPCIISVLIFVCLWQKKLTTDGNKL